MLLEPTTDQEFFRETTARFLSEQAPPSALRSLRDDPTGYDRDYWRRGCELGWTSLLIGEDQGGGSISGDGLMDLTLVAHEFGAHAAPGPFVATNVVAGALSRNGSHTELLAEVIAGTAVVTWAHAEGPPHDRLDAIACQITRDGDAIVVRGTKRPVEHAGQASHLLVTGRTGDGLTQVLVAADAPGITIEPMTSVDQTRRFAVVTFDDVRVPADAVVGDVGGADADVDRQLLDALVMVNAESVGAMQTAFDMTIEWAFDRYSFGRPLASYQAIKHRSADMKTTLEASHAIADTAARAVASAAPRAERLARAAKAYIGDQGAELMQECVQFHGGIGVTYEHDLHLYHRRHTVDRAVYGTPEEHRRHLGRNAATEGEAA